DHLVRPAGNRNDNAKIQTFPAKETLALGDGDGERKDAALRRIGLPVAQIYRLTRDGAGVPNDIEKHCDEDAQAMGHGAADPCLRQPAATPADN
ncbi:MAG: hypothetical protein ABW172_08385, partial [Candidatus Binatia bacterium]